MKKEEIIEFIRATPPFHLLDEKWSADLYDALTVVHFDKDEVIFTAQYPINRVFVIISGEVNSFVLEQGKEKILEENLSAKDIFGYISIIFNNHRSIKNIVAKSAVKAITFNDTFFMGLCKRKQEFADYFNQKFGIYMLDNDFRRLFSQTKNTDTQKYLNADNVLTQKISSIYTRKIVTVTSNSSIQEVAEMMTKKLTNIIIIINKEKELIGYITDIAFRENVIIKHIDVTEEVNKIMFSPIPIIDEETEFAEAFTKMSKDNLQYLVVKKSNGKYGILSKNKLLSTQSDGPILFMQGIYSSKSLDELKNKWAETPKMVQQLITRGVRSEISTSLITEISNRVIKNVIFEILEEMGPPPVPFAFITCGSEGRLEKTLSSDQDNGLIFKDVSDDLLPKVSAYFLALGEKICTKLSYVGFPICSGGFMAKTKKWNQPLSVWKSYYQDWFNNPTTEKAMNATVFLDSRWVYGDKSLVTELSNFVTENSPKANAYFYATIAQNCLEFKPPLTIFRQFKTSKYNGKEVINIKKAMMPIVDYTRIKSLQLGIRNVNTGERLKEIFKHNVINKKEYYELMQSYYYMMNLRLKSQQKMGKSSRKEGNYIVPSQLTQIERVTLKQIFKIIESYQQVIKLLFKKLS